jgi:RNA polymerase sigma factor (TIGR02999 family)
MLVSAIAEPLEQVQLRDACIHPEQPAAIRAMGADETPESNEARTAVTDCLKEWRNGDELARDRLFDLVYEYLRVQARRALRHERGDHTLGTTDLVHEAYLRLVAPAAGEWRDRSHFFATAARAMRRILVDHARKRGAHKRGAGGERIPLLEEIVAVDQRAEHVLALDEALTRLGTIDPRLASVVEYRYFAGLTEEETADLMGVTARTVRRDWVKARGWLYRELSLDETGPSEHG